MIDHAVELLQSYKSFALFISIFLNVMINIIGFVPSVFLTGANLVVFGFWKGTLVSFVGEGVGAVVSFVLYRKGLRKMVETKAFQRPNVKRLLEVEGKQAFALVISLRILPFVPSGVITFLAAIGRMSLGIFVVSSTLGKLPALFLEAYSVNHVVQWTWQGKTIITVLAGLLLIAVLKRTSAKK
ncbi:TVP38/TMEM64 family protein [Bacillus sp. 1NLA3E]|uniref:TVP38/TMEM64 family protein n=1 Tax=Bacillus sp. 1NLA3E TaxID=666686 RepID=UPI000247EE3B|nr:VTT domain-containing protein [Bacillus sp. 1NLA3E]AGK55642.1 hypothetical protein B1NLA3E_19490 [Bacillus sp. 1NLA3E]